MRSLVLLLGSLVVAAPLVAGSPYLIQSIDPLSTKQAWVPTAMSRWNGHLLFSKSTGSEQDGLWSLDPDSLELALVTHLVSGWEQGLVAAAPGFMIWRGFDGDLDFEVLHVVRSDGTAEGTFTLSTGPPQNSDQEGTTMQASIGERVLFSGFSSSSGWVPWITDGTLEGTHPVIELQPGAPGSNPRHFVSYGSGACFEADSQDGSSIYCTDGTPNGTHEIAGSPPYLAVHPTPTRIGSKVLFLGWSGDGVELYSTDGTNGGTTRLTFLPEASPFLTGLVSRDGSAYFLASDGLHGPELWQSNGTVGGTRRITDFDSPFAFQGTYLSEGSVARIGEWSYFFATDGVTPRRIWRTNGDPASTGPVALSCAEGAWIDDLRISAVGGRLIFFQWTTESGFESWASDPDGSRCELLVDACPGTCDGDPRGPFQAEHLDLIEAGPPADRELYRTDGTVAGTAPVTAVPGGYARTVETGRRLSLAWLDGRLWFSGVDDLAGGQVWSTSLAPESTALATAFGSDPISASTRGMEAIGDSVVVLVCTADGHLRWMSASAALDSLVDLGVPDTSCDPFSSSLDRTEGLPGRMLYFPKNPPARAFVSNATPEGTGLLLEFETPSSIEAIERSQGRVFFTVVVAGSREIWSTDGTEAGSRLEVDLGTTFGDVSGFHKSGSKLFFTANSSGQPSLAWVWDSDLDLLTPLPPALELVPRLPDGHPTFVELAGGVFFVDRRGGAGGTLWRYDLASGGTKSILALGESSGFRSLLGSVGGRLTLLSWDDPADPGVVRLWAADGTPGSLELLASLGHTSQRISEMDIPLLLAEPYLILATPSDESGLEMWATDGTVGGTVAVPETMPGPVASNPTSLTASESAIFFVARDRQFGRELWELQKANGALRRISDIGPGTISGGIREVAISASGVFMIGDDGVHGLSLWYRAFGGPGCPESPRTLCLQSSRFQVEAHWRDFFGAAGDGAAVQLTPDTGYFWYFDAANVEAVVKVLDGLGVNNRFWVFYGALSNVDYAVDVTDTEQQVKRRYFNPPGRYASVGDVNAFSPEGHPTPPYDSLALGDLADLNPRLVASFPSTEDASSTCDPSMTRLCLQQGRFAVEASWRDFQGNTGVGTAVPLSADTGYFWFFVDTNVEAIVKVLDGRPVNDRFWVYYGALSNVEYTLTVTDTLTGAVRQYFNSAGRFASVGDNDAF